MIKILFICHGNICRSTMAQYIFEEMVRNEGLEESFEIDSAATSREEIGNDVDRRARKKLGEEGIPCGHHRARQVTKADYEDFDYLVLMDEETDTVFGASFQGIRSIKSACSWTGQRNPGMWQTPGIPGTLTRLSAISEPAAVPLSKSYHKASVFRIMGQPPMVISCDEEVRQEVLICLK